MMAKTWKKGFHSSSVIPFISLKSRKGIVLGIAAILLLVLVSPIYYFHLQKEIVLVVNGQEKEIKTFKKTVQELLAEQSIELTSNDKISAALDANLEDEQKVIITYAKPLTLVVSGEQRKIYTTKTTVNELMKEQMIQLNELDRVEPSLESQIQPDMLVKIVRVTKEVVKEQEEVKFGLVRKADSTLANGQEKVINKGKNGSIQRTYEVTYEDGVEVDKNLLEETVVEPKLDEIVAYGTVQTVSRGGINFKPTKILDNVKITMYSAGAEHTGKTSEHPQYGITYTGTRVQEGRTIAVDPKVIPLGWWVYIEGFGFRRAEDTGGAVKGNVIDIYTDNNQQALNFGAKRGYKVYVIGPNRPAN